MGLSTERRQTSLSEAAEMRWVRLWRSGLVVQRPVGGGRPAERHQHNPCSTAIPPVMPGCTQMIPRVVIGCGVLACGGRGRCPYCTAASLLAEVVPLRHQYGYHSTLQEALLSGGQEPPAAFHLSTALQRRSAAFMAARVMAGHGGGLEGAPILA